MTQLSKRQCKTLLFLFLLAGFLSAGSHSEAGRDAWLAAAPAVALALVLFAAVVSPLVLCGQSDLLSAHRLLLGRPVGGLVNVALLILALLYGAGEMTGLAAFLAESSDFSPRLGALALLLVALYAAGRGLLCLGRGSEILWAVLLALLALFFLLPLSQLRPELLLPVARTPWRTIVREGVGTLLEWFLPAYFLLALLGDTPRRSDLFPALFRAVLTAGVALVLAVAYNIMALGALASESDYPAYLTAALIEIGQFVRRPEALIAGVQVLGTLFRLSIYLLFAARAWESVCPRGAHRRRVLAMGAAVFALYAAGVTGAPGWSRYALLALPLLIALLALVRWLITRRKRHKTPAGAG